MSKVNPDELWFSTPDAGSLCRGGGNGENHPSQLYAIKKYVHPGVSFLDYGAGSGTTYEALVKAGIKVDYLGVDIIPKFTNYCKERFPEGSFAVNPSIHKIDQKDKSFDVVYSRHVVDHMNSFEEAMEEHLRVAKDLAIVVFWVPMGNGDEHSIKNIVDGPQDNRKTYTNEYTNCYARTKVMAWLEEKNKEWELVELAEEVGKEVSGHDWIIVLKRRT